MSTWTNVTDTVLEPGQPIRSVDIIAIKNNIIAVPNGATGAPRIVDAALGSTVTSNGTNWVLARTAGASAGAVGTYAFLGQDRVASAQTITAVGGTRAGSSLRYTSAISAESSATLNGGTPPGTWRCMGAFGAVTGSRAFQTLWLRIS